MKTTTMNRLLLTLIVLSASSANAADQGEWVELISGDFSGWRDRGKHWQVVGDASLSDRDNRRLSVTKGAGVLAVAGSKRASDLYTKKAFRDVELRLEYMLPKRSNSGVKLNGLYEIQMRDTYGQKIKHGDQNGGIYPRADNRYRLIDKGFLPLVDATRPAGEWQSLRVRFRSPRFDAEGKKTANARFELVVLNGETIHKDVEVPYPTGWAWNHRDEVAEGPVMLQGDHGNVAFRKVAVRPLPTE